MNIIFLGRYNPTEFLTGPEKVARRIFDTYTKHCKAVFIEYFFDGRKYGLFKKLFGTEIVSTSENSEVLRMGIFPLLRYLNNFKPDIIHIITYERFAVMAFVYRIFSRVKIIYNIHGVVLHENSRYKKESIFYIYKDKLCEGVFLKRSDKLIFLSERSVNIAIHYFRFNRKKIDILPNGIDEVFNIKGRERIYSAEDRLKIVFTGNVNRKEKGFDFLKESLDQSDVPFELFLTGDNNPSDNKDYLCIPFLDNVSFAEFLSDKDIFVSASAYEPFSMAAAEAMATGLIPVVTKQTGMSRYVEDSRNGFIFDYGDTVALNKILNSLYQNKSSLGKYSERAKMIYDQLSWCKVIEMYKKLYENLLSSG